MKKQTLSYLLFFPFPFLFLSSLTFAADNIKLFGKFEQGTLLKGQAPVGAQLFLNGKSVRATDSGKFVVGFGREAELTNNLKAILVDGTEINREVVLTKKKYRIQRVNGIAKKIMKPEPKAVARSKKDSQQVRAARNTDSDLDGIFTRFIWPAKGPISGVYGSQRVYNGVPSRPHYGVDVAKPTGTPVVAPANGIITLAVPDMFYSGGTIIIDHGYGVSSSMLHLSKLDVVKGQSVKQGQKIGEIGSTGRSTGPHLDWRINWYQMRLDPTTIVPPMQVVLKDSH
ncbi:M23 family metallopeptidase [Parashewanella tropica]|uniref:M23 family metallopeptidase n=1 Tax=Parashewanella tropica TaxID=2547970 RepID=UPI00105AAAE7|nr:M23 family metallopeptidase [Parashewanella tropica]